MGPSWDDLRRHLGKVEKPARYVGGEDVYKRQPPVNIVTDAAILSQLVDATIFVIRHGEVKKDEALYALERLKKVDAKIIGAVLNAAPAGNGAYYYYEYGPVS